MRKQTRTRLPARAVHRKAARVFGETALVADRDEAEPLGGLARGLVGFGGHEERPVTRQKGADVVQVGQARGAAVARHASRRSRTGVSASTAMRSRRLAHFAAGEHAVRKKAPEPVQVDLTAIEALGELVTVGGSEEEIRRSGRRVESGPGDQVHRRALGAFARPLCQTSVAASPGAIHVGGAVIADFNARRVYHRVRAAEPDQIGLLLAQHRAATARSAPTSPTGSTAYPGQTGYY